MKTLILFAVLAGAFLSVLPQDAEARCRGCGRAPLRRAAQAMVPGRAGGCANGQCR